MKNPISWSTASKSISLACLISASLTAFAQNSPRLMQDPVLGLRYQAGKIQLDALPGEVQSACPVVNAEWDRHLWVYASTRDGAKSYYVVGGYFVHRQQSASAPRFEADVRGGGFRGEECALRTTWAGARSFRVASGRACGAHARCLGRRLGRQIYTRIWRCSPAARGNAASACVARSTAHCLARRIQAIATSLPTQRG